MITSVQYKDKASLEAMLSQDSGKHLLQVESYVPQSPHFCNWGQTSNQHGEQGAKAKSWSSQVVKPTFQVPDGDHGHMPMSKDSTEPRDADMSWEGMERKEHLSQDRTNARRRAEGDSLSMLAQLGTWSSSEGKEASPKKTARRAGAPATRRSTRLPALRFQDRSPHSQRTRDREANELHNSRDWEDDSIDHGNHSEWWTAQALLWIARKKKSAQRRDDHSRFLDFCRESSVLSKLDQFAEPDPFKPRAKLGFSVIGREVSELEPWGPAHLSEEIFAGDEILKVDGTSVVPGNIAQRILGSDKPNSIVELQVKRADGSGIRDVRILRSLSASSGVSDMLYQTLTQLGDDMSMAYETMADDDEGMPGAAQVLEDNLNRVEMIFDLGEKGFFFASWSAIIHPDYLCSS